MLPVTIPAFTGAPLSLRPLHSLPLQARQTLRTQPKASLSLSRRRALSLLALGALSPALPALSTVSYPLAARAAEESLPPGELVLPALPYAYSGLEPAIDRETMHLHHDTHFAKYTAGAIAALAKIPGATARVDGDPGKLAELLGDLDSVKDEDVRKALRNNGGGYLNHYQYFATMSPAPKPHALPAGALGDEIISSFGTFDSFKTAFTKASLGLFGSGFVYLIRPRGGAGKLAIKAYPNQDTPVMDGDLPVVGLDVWEHAYYKRYGAARGEYVDAWFSVVNWDLVGRNFRPTAAEVPASSG